MIDDTLAKIESRLRDTEALSDSKRRELQQLLTTLRAEISKLPQDSREQAESIAGFAERSAHEATREQQNPHLLKLSLEGMGSSVREFEKTHPKLVQIVNLFSQTLSNLGI